MISLDELKNTHKDVYRVCKKCGERYFYCYWDFELNSYIYMSKHYECLCNKCKNSFCKLV